MAIAVVLIALAISSNWHRHDSTTGACSFNHADSIQAEAPLLHVLDHPTPRFRPDLPEAANQLQDGRSSRSTVPRGPPLPVPSLAFA